VAGVRLKVIDVGTNPRSFELLCVRIDSGASSCVALVVYRPGSTAVTPSFFTELSDVLDRVVTLADPIYVVGDFNVHLELVDDLAANQLTSTFAAYGLECRVTSPTHDQGGMLDVVATRVDLPAPSVEVLDVGISDHHLLRWSAPLHRPSPVYTSVNRRPWRQLDAAAFRAALSASPLCQPDRWAELSIDELAQLYDDEATAILDRLIPARTVRCRRRPSDPWFDDECRDAKRRCRMLERAARKSAAVADAAAVADVGAVAATADVADAAAVTDAVAVINAAAVVATSAVADAAAVTGTLVVIDAVAVAGAVAASAAVAAAAAVTDAAAVTGTLAVTGAVPVAAAVAAAVAVSGAVAVIDAAAGVATAAVTDAAAVTGTLAVTGAVAAAVAAGAAVTAAVAVGAAVVGAAAVAVATEAWYAERRSYRELLRRKREEFWQAKVESERSSPRQLWRSVDALLGRGRTPASTTIGAVDFHQFFDEKVAGVRAATADAPPPSFTSCPTDCVFSAFQSLAVDDVIAAIRKLPDKQCLSDPIPTRLLKDSADILAPYVVELLNRSLSTGSVPSAFKAAYITPLLKKANLDPDDVRSYRPISNLSVTSKAAGAASSSTTAELPQHL